MTLLDMDTHVHGCALLFLYINLNIRKTHISTLNVGKVKELLFDDMLFDSKYISEEFLNRFLVSGFGDCDVYSSLILIIGVRVCL